MKKLFRAMSLSLVYLSLVLQPLHAQQLASVANPASAARASGESKHRYVENQQPEIAVLQKRVSALRRYLSSINPNYSEYRATEQAINELNLKLQNLTGGLKNNVRSEVVAASIRKPILMDATPLAPVPLQNTATNSYKDAPPLLSDVVDKVVDYIVSENKTDPLSAGWQQMLFYTVADAVAPPATATNARSIRKLKAYQYLGETARTDKQVGAPAKSAGSTSAVEKPGFARLLGLAVENGAILQDVSKTSLTLSTSPYILYTLSGNGDTAENYQRAGFLNRFGLFANFNLQNEDVALANATRSQLASWSIKTRLYGDRSTRSSKFQTFWDDEIREPITNRLNAIIGASVFLDDSRFDPLTKTEDALNAQIKTLLADATFKSKDALGKKQALTNLIMSYMKGEVFDKINSGTFAINSADRDEINNRHVNALAESLKNLDFVRGVLNERLDDLSNSPLATFAYTNYRQPMGSDYSEFKFLYEQDKSVFRLLKLVGNAGFTLYNKPDAAMNQERFRDFNAALSFEGTTPRPLLRNGLDLSKLTYAFTGTYQRMMENQGMANRKADIAAFQFRVEMPLFAGVSLPFAVTYANGTEHTNKKHTRANFGISFDVDKMFAATQLAK